MPQELWIFWAACLGLVVGSFGNVVIHRLPRMMERQWDQEARHWWAEQNPSSVPSEVLPAEEAPYDLARPGSHCPACGHVLPWRERIPLLSYLWLRGRCSACAQAIGWRSPAVELSAALLFAACAWRWGIEPQALIWA